MKQACPYCNKLHKALKDQNYCSKQGDHIEKTQTNAYYFKSNNLNSGEHISRFSVRTISDGFQFHKVNNVEYLLDSQHYLIIQEGEAFTSELRTNTPVEGLLVAFNKEDVNASAALHCKNVEEQLQDPFESSKTYIDFDTNKLQLSPKLNALFEALKTSIQTEKSQQLLYDQIFKEIMIEIYSDQKKHKSKIQNIQAIKYSTQKEIFKRISAAKEYMDINYHENISLDQLSKISTISSYYFLRCFKACLNITPYQYLVQQRINHAKFLLRDSDDLVSNIAQSVGFQNDSSFGRTFKNYVRTTPLQYRIQQTSKQMFI